MTRWPDRLDLADLHIEPNVHELTTRDKAELRAFARWHLPHVEGWETVPCPCAVCRADRVIDRIAGVLIGVCIGYFGAHIAIAVIR